MENRDIDVPSYAWSPATQAVHFRVYGPRVGIFRRRAPAVLFSYLDGGRADVRFRATILRADMAARRRGARFRGTYSMHDGHCLLCTLLSE